MAEPMKRILSEKLEPFLIREGLQELEVELRKISGDLKVDIMELEASGSGWVSIEYSGDDSEVFTEALKRRYGFAPVEFSRLAVGDIYRGFITDSGRVGFGLYLDIGVMSPSRLDGLYPLHRMRAQLADGSSQPLRQILRRLGLHDGLPLDVRIEELAGTGKMTLALTDKQESCFKDWERYPFDRVIVVGSLLRKVHAAIRKSGLEGDILGVERLSLTVHILTCKLGTEAPGVIAKLGRHLSTARLYPFIPRWRIQTGKAVEAGRI